MEKAKVYFTKEITSESVVKMYEKLGKELTGKVALKVHSGEAGNQNYLHPEFMKPIINRVNGTIVECNTAYAGQRNNTEKHKKLMEDHGWSKRFDVDIMDAEGPDLEIEIPNGKVIKQNYLGKNIKNYDSMLVLSHFKGHAMAGFGGAVKNISIGFASSNGKSLIHSAGARTSGFGGASQDDFLESMAEAVLAVSTDKGDDIIYISVMNNLSVDCDCDSNPAEPDMHDIGILASKDPVALDKACVDLVYSAQDGESLIERMESRNGIHTLEYGAQIGLGNLNYELVNIDDRNN